MGASLCPEVSAARAVLIADHEDRVAIAMLHIHLFQGQVRSLVSDRYDIGFLLEHFVLSTVCVDKDTALLARLEDEYTILFRRPNVIRRAVGGLLVSFDLTVEVDLNAKLFQHRALEAVFFSFVCGGGEADDEDFLVGRCSVEVSQVAEHTLVRLINNEDASVSGILPALQVRLIMHPLRESSALITESLQARERVLVLLEQPLVLKDNVDIM